MEENYFVQKSSYIDEESYIGEGTKIWHFCHLLPKTKIGKNCILGQNIMVGPEVKIGNNCKIQNNVSIYKGIIFEDNVFCGPSAVFTNVPNPRAFIERKNEFKKTIVREGATIGANATIICGTIIGKFSLIGAGAVLTKSTPDYSLFLGVPAKLSGWVCKCGEVLTREIISKEEKILHCVCGNQYKFFENKISPIKENEN